MNFGYPGCENVAGECKLQISEMNKRIHASVGDVYNIKRKKPAQTFGVRALTIHT